jgi:integrase/recombinase XerD
MTNKAISPLRRRMIEDMTIGKLGPKTQTGYIRADKNFAAFLGRSPDRANIEDIRRYQLHLASSSLGVPSANSALTELRFCFDGTLRRGDVTEDIVFACKLRRLSVVLSPEKVARLLATAAGVKYEAVLSLAYGAGMRASEVISLKANDIDIALMLIRVDHGTSPLDLLLSEGIPSS